MHTPWTPRSLAPAASPSPAFFPQGGSPAASLFSSPAGGPPARRRYERVTLLGESLGTLAMGHLLTVKDLPRPGCVRLIARGGGPAA